MRLNLLTFVAAPLALAAALSGCATPNGPVEVTRFSRPGATAARGPVSVVAAVGTRPGLAFSPFADAVSRELARAGYAPQPGAAVLAEVTVEQSVSGPEPRGNPVSVGVGGATGGYGSGLGVGVGINLSGRPKPVIDTLLAVTLRDRATGLSLWEGRAHAQVREGSPQADAPGTADRLARALFQGYPGRSGETVNVK